jgi:prepilin-type N-terminal cleavage/methylation domain-containing protein
MVVSKKPPPQQVFFRPTAARGLFKIFYDPTMRHRGFSFIEVMFAVVVLGIGSILVAAIFPVAIQQTLSTADDAAAAQLAREAMHIITTSTTADQYPANSGVTQPFSSQSALWSQISSNVICQSDPRYAWVPYYSRHTQDGLITITILIVRRSSHPVYTQADTQSSRGELIPRGVTLQNFQVSPNGSATVDVVKGSAAYQSVAPDTFLIGSNGQTFRTGSIKSEDAGTVTWTLHPEVGSFTDDAAFPPAAQVIGRDWINPSVDPTQAPTQASSAYDGPAQDVAVFNSVFLAQ